VAIRGKRVRRGRGISRYEGRDYEESARRVRRSYGLEQLPAAATPTSPAFRGHEYDRRVTWPRPRFRVVARLYPRCTGDGPAAGMAMLFDESSPLVEDQPRCGPKGLQRGPHHRGAGFRDGTPVIMDLVSMEQRLTPSGLVDFAGPGLAFSPLPVARSTRGSRPKVFFCSHPPTSTVLAPRSAGASPETGLLRLPVGAGGSAVRAG